MNKSMREMKQLNDEPLLNLWRKPSQLSIAIYDCPFFL